MKQFFKETQAVIGAVIQDICLNVDLEVVSLPGGSLIAVLLSLCAIAMGSTRCAATQNRASRTAPRARNGASSTLPPNGACVVARDYLLALIRLRSRYRLHKGRQLVGI